MNTRTPRLDGNLFKAALSFLTMCVLALGLCASTVDAQVPRVIFDSDMSSDWDDVGDIAVLHGLASMGECQIIGMAVSSQNGATCLCMDAINTYYGKPNIPIGVRPDTQGNGGYPAQIASEFPHGPETSWTQFPLAVNLYRQLLAASPDNSVIIVTAGYLNNIQALLQSGPDSYSSLSGPALVSQKVKLLACIGGQYPSGDEFNFKVEPTAASYVVNNWPARVTYTGFELGNQIRTAGRIAETPATNPIRRVYVDIENNYPYPSWTQIGELQAIRGSASGYFGAVTVGRNNADSTAHNFWTATPDPTGNQDQAYLLEKVRFPVIEELNALMNLAPNNGTASKPGWPSNVRATVVGSTINLQWTDNAFNETGFIIERRTNGVYSQIGSVGTNVTTFTDSTPSTIANASYRVKAYNATGESSSSYVWVYSGWTEINFAGSGTTPPLYSYYQQDLHWARGGDFRPDHVALNNDSTHGTTLTVDVDVSTTGQEGNFYVYFFYQDANNWYRLNVGQSSCQFEKKVGGTLSQIGASASITNIGSGSGPNHWMIEVTPAGNLKFTRTMPYASAPEISQSIVGTLLNVTQALSFSTGKIGLGGNARTPIWENFTFATTGGGGSAPSAPTGLGATAGNGQVTLNWTASGGATSYNVYRGTTAGGESVTPIATGITGTTYINSSLTNGTAYYYKVAAVNSFGTSGYSNEASATPTAGGSAPAAPTGLSAMAGNAQVSLSWTASSGATSYNVYRGTTAGGESTTPVATGITGTTYTSTGLSNATVYYYKVAAVNSFGTSGYSNEASATPTAGVPAAPTGLTATAGNAQVSLNWTASAGATSYNVYRGTSAGGENATPIVTGVTTTTYTNTGLTNGTTYYYKIAAVNSSGTSAQSNEASATPAAGGGSVAFANASFETPAVGSYTYSSTGTSWTFTNYAGIQHNGSAYSGTGPVAPDGVQTGFVQGVNGQLGTMSQNVTFPAGTFVIKFQAAQRYGQVQPIKVTVDSTVVGTYTPASSNYAQITTASFTVTAGSHTVTFAATDNSADKSSFVDLMSIQ